MKRHLSVLMLAAGSTVCKIAGLLLAMAAAEGALFYITLKSLQGGPGSLEQVFTQSRIALVSGLFFLILCALLSLTWCELRGSRLRYTMGRLSVREETTAVWHAAYNVLILFVFWAAQLAVALLLCRYYASVADPAYVSRQTVFLAFYRQKFLHSLLPLGETTRYIRNAALILSLGVSAASFSYRQRHGLRGVAVALLAAFTVAVFAGNMGSFSGDILVSLAALAVATGAATKNRKEWRDET
jgi:hypothetical protein